MNYEHAILIICCPKAFQLILTSTTTVFPSLIIYSYTVVERCATAVEPTLNTWCN